VRELGDLLLELAQLTILGKQLLGLEGHHVTGRSRCSFADVSPIGLMTVLYRSEEASTPSFPAEVT